MSDFLVNLALRSMGLAETIRPRLPALFESPPLYGGLMASPSLFPFKRDEEPFQQDVPGGGDVSGGGMEAPTDHLYVRRQPLDADPASPALDTHEPIMARPGHQTWRATVASPTQSLGHLHSLSSRGPLDAQHVPLSRPKSSFIPESPRSESLPQLGRVQVETSRPPIVSPGHSEREVRDGLGDLAIDQRPLPAETKPHFSPPQTNSQRLPNSQTVLPPPSIIQLAPKATRTIEPPPSPGWPVTGSAAGPRSNPSEPTVRVTIGRVEVRAVFSDPPVRHAQPRQSRRTITLDEYLKCSSRGRR